LDQAAWERLVELYGPLVYAWCRQAGLQEADALDIGQEVFRSVLAAIADFRRDRPGDSFRAWLRTIVRNKIRDRSRRAGVKQLAAQDLIEQVWAEQGPEPDAPSVACVAAETVNLCRRAVELIRGEFSEVYFRAFWQVVVLGRSPADVAEELDISVNSVYLAKSRILRRLREEFAGLLDEKK
jgi:RNA polymerase sigma-70 factor (ECF subfamily)